MWQLLLIGIALTGILAVALIVGLVWWAARMLAEDSDEDGSQDLPHGDSFPVDFIPRDPVRRARFTNLVHQGKDQ